MPWTSEHIKWFKDTGESLKTVDGKTVEVWEFRHLDDEEVLSAWAKHFRNHYCLDCDLDLMRGKKSRGDYLTNLKFPCKTTKLGPAIRAGDFGEILVSDYLQWVLDFWVPRVRWSSKFIRDESPKGSDVIGFHLLSTEKTSDEDLLAVFETKTRFSKGSNRTRLQDAVNDSAKDHIRIDESLNFIKQKLYDRDQKNDALKVQRFQNPVDVPYKEIYGAAALFSNNLFDTEAISETDTTKIPKSKKKAEFFPHPNRDQLVLIVIRGEKLTELQEVSLSRTEISSILARVLKPGAFVRFFVRFDIPGNESKFVLQMRLKVDGKSEIKKALTLKVNA